VAEVDEPRGRLRTALHARVHSPSAILERVVLFLAFDSAVKLLRLDVAVEGTTRLGYPADLVVVIGLIELMCLLAVGIGVFIWGALWLREPCPSFPLGFPQAAAACVLAASFMTRASSPYTVAQASFISGVNAAPRPFSSVHSNAAPTVS
jgi:DoxX-like protein